MARHDGRFRLRRLTVYMWLNAHLIHLFITTVVTSLLVCRSRNRHISYKHECCWLRVENTAVVHLFGQVTSTRVILTTTSSVANNCVCLYQMDLSVAAAARWGSRWPLTRGPVYQVGQLLLLLLLLFSYFCYFSQIAHSQ